MTMERHSCTNDLGLNRDPFETFGVDGEAVLSPEIR